MSARPDVDPHAEAVRALSERDARLAALIDRVGPCRLALASGGAGVTGAGSAAEVSAASARDHLAGLVEAIVSQQLSSKAAATIFGRVRALGRDPAVFLDAAEILALPDQALRAVGLSAAKAAGVRDLCERVERGSLRLADLDALPDDAVIEQLCEVRGIGRWTAEMFLMFRLGRKDVLPVADLGIQKGIQALFSLRKRPSPERMQSLARPWRPYRSIACWYLWRMGEL